MRELKFRAWDNDYGEMRSTDFALSRNGRVFWVNSDGAMKGMFEAIEYEPYYPHRSRFIVEQYTGLKDKNGKEIYEGDVVRLERWYASGAMGYSQPHVQVTWSNEHCGFDPFANYDSDCDVYHLASESEVIGNIHENPELLESK